MVNEVEMISKDGLREFQIEEDGTLAFHLHNYLDCASIYYYDEYDEIDLTNSKYNRINDFIRDFIDKGLDIMTVGALAEIFNIPALLSLTIIDGHEFHNFSYDYDSDNLYYSCISENVSISISKDVLLQDCLSLNKKEIFERARNFHIAEGFLARNTVFFKWISINQNSYTIEIPKQESFIQTFTSEEYFNSVDYRNTGHVVNFNSEQMAIVAKASFANKKVCFRVDSLCADGTFNGNYELYDENDEDVL